MTRTASHLIGSEILLEVGSDDGDSAPALVGVDLAQPVASHSRHIPKPEPIPSSTVVGLLLGFSEAGRPLVNFCGIESSEPIESRTTVPLGSHQVGSQVVLIFEQADRFRPIILGVLCDPTPTAPKELPLVASMDDEQLILSAKREIVLRCGKASITLTRAGKVIIRGAYLLSRSSGVNRIKGGSVQIN